MQPLLIVRPEPGASATAAKARAMGMTTVVASLFEVGAVAWTPPEGRVDAVMATSANALRLGGDDLRRFLALPLFAVGAATAAAARQVGFGDVRAGGEDAAAVVQLMEEAGVSRALHPAGRERTPLPPTSVDVTVATVYAAEAVEVTLPVASGVAMLHSRRAAQRFGALAPDRAAFALVAISAAVGEAAGSGWRRVVWPDAPGDDAMLALARPLCEGSSDHGDAIP